MKHKIKLFTRLSSLALLAGSLFGVLGSVSFKSAEPIETNAAISTLREIDLLEFIDTNEKADGKESNVTCFMGFGDSFLYGSTTSTSSNIPVTLVDEARASIWYYRVSEVKNVTFMSNTFVKSGKNTFYLNCDYGFFIKKVSKPQSMMFGLTPYQYNIDGTDGRIPTISYTSNDGHTYYLSQDSSNSHSVRDTPTSQCEIKFYIRGTNLGKRTASTVATLFNKYWIENNNLNLTDASLDNLDFIRDSWFLLMKQYKSLPSTEKQELYCQDELYTNFLSYYNLILERYGNQKEFPDFLEPQQQEKTAEDVAREFNQGLSGSGKQSITFIENTTGDQISLPTFCSFNAPPVPNLEPYLATGSNLLLYNKPEIIEIDEWEYNNATCFRDNFTTFIEAGENCLTIESYLAKDYGRFAFKNDVLNEVTKVELCYDCTSIKERNSGYWDSYIEYLENEEIKTKKINFTRSLGTDITETFIFENPVKINKIEIGYVDESDEDEFTIKLHSIDFYSSSGGQGACDSMGTNTNTSKLKEIWAIAATQYESLNPEEKAKFISSSVGEILEMISKYDYIYAKYGASLELDDFLGRGQTSNANKKVLKLSEIQDSTWIIAVVSIIGLTSVGAYFFYRKRKEE